MKKPAGKGGLCVVAPRGEACSPRIPQLQDQIYWFFLLMSNNDCLLSEIEDMRNVLSAPRLATYEDALKRVSPSGFSTTDVLDFYLWNAEVSGALFVTMQLCEVVIRNAASQAIVSIYGEDWPWNQTFVGSLANNEKDILKKGSRDFAPSMTGKVVAAMTLIFWEKMFTARHDERIWNQNLKTVFPNLDPNLSVAKARERIYSSMKDVRALRNRIAHHEPIFNCDINGNYQKIQWLIGIRCKKTASWMEEKQHVSSLLQSCPVPLSSLQKHRSKSKRKKR